jgi:metallopeptidase MepB
LHQAFEREDGSRECPATALICNFTRPTTNKPSLLGHEEVQLFFHELGHGIHDLVAKTKYSIFHGTATVDDFCEAPSQMLEYWCWLPQILQTLSHHYSYISPDCLTAWRDQTDSKSQPPKQLPIDVIDRLFESKNVNGSLYQLRLLHRSYFDMKVHQPRNMQDIIDLDISAEYNKQQTNISFLDSPEGGDNWGHGHAKFDALVRVYDAGFYGYV